MRLVLLTLVFLGLALSGMPSMGAGPASDECCDDKDSCCFVEVEESCCEVDSPEVSIAPGCPCGQHGPGDAVGCTFKLVLQAPQKTEERFQREDPSWIAPGMDRVQGRVPSPETPPPRLQAS